GQIHLPSPRSLGGQDRRAPTAIVFRDEERHLFARRGHIRQHGGAWFRRAGILVIHQVRQLLPMLLVTVRVFVQTANDAVFANRGQLSSRWVTMERVLVIWQHHRKKIGHIGRCPTSVRQRRTARKQQGPSTAHIDELLN